MRVRDPKRKVSERGEPAPQSSSGQASRPSAGSRRTALLAAQAGLDKRAAEIEIIDVTGKVDYADYLVLMTGHSDRHVATIAHAVDEVLGQHGSNAISVEGLPRGSWVLLDFVDVVVHVLLQDSRALYDLDGLWMDARRIPLPEKSPDGA